MDPIEISPYLIKGQVRDDSCTNTAWKLRQLKSYLASNFKNHVFIPQIHWCFEQKVLSFLPTTCECCVDLTGREGLTNCT